MISSRIAKCIRREYRLLRRRYGRPAGQWTLWCKRPKSTRDREQVIVESILTARTNWRNVERATENLRDNGVLSLSGLLTPGDALAEIIRSSGFYRAKTRYLVSLARFAEKNADVRALAKRETDELRRTLLSLAGIGEETADDILLYALDKPVFVIDEYTRRLARRLGFEGGLSYGALKEIFEASVPRILRMYQDFHALIVIDGKNRK